MHVGHPQEAAQLAEDLQHLGGGGRFGGNSEVMSSSSSGEDARAHKVAAIALTAVNETPSFLPSFLLKQ